MCWVAGGGGLPPRSGGPVTWQLNFFCSFHMSVIAVSSRLLPCSVAFSSPPPPRLSDLVGSLPYRQATWAHPWHLKRASSATLFILRDGPTITGQGLWREKQNRHFLKACIAGGHCSHLLCSLRGVGAWVSPLVSHTPSGPGPPSHPHLLRTFLKPPVSSPSYPDSAPTCPSLLRSEPPLLPSGPLMCAAPLGPLSSRLGHSGNSCLSR